MPTRRHATPSAERAADHLFEPPLRHAAIYDASHAADYAERHAIYAAIYAEPPPSLRRRAYTPTLPSAIMSR